MTGRTDQAPLVRLTVPATASAPALILRPWRPADAAALPEVYRDETLRRWTSGIVTDEASAVRWVRDQRRGWETGDRYTFAVLESGERGDRLAGHVVLKRAGADPAVREVGYWTAGHARGRGVASRALGALTEWAFTGFADIGGHRPTRLRLLHQLGNTASCRVAHKCAYELTGTLPPAPPHHPEAGHVHERVH
ncbi:GNAT family N-acetyltransferase [Streptomyces sp. V3I7]|uniref:GNAT family N-acetyltransferase n=1 Tax=Streptomyces sp. V3I7 TaxID=3042278 RepID=UPI002786C616|nr:GNAT family N-acetyltransferase [Streptomyces sp. V3I7]MDQ0989558.1 RimJ/RimL family protein N-acetyltransferase [Streptomyces sp. V3I7]